MYVGYLEEGGGGCTCYSLPNLERMCPLDYRDFLTAHYMDLQQCSIKNYVRLVILSVNILAMEHKTFSQAPSHMLSMCQKPMWHCHASKTHIPHTKNWKKFKRSKKGLEHMSNTWTQLYRTQVNYGISLFYLFSNRSDLTRPHFYFADIYMAILNIRLSKADPTRLSTRIRHEIKRVWIKNFNLFN